MKHKFFSFILVAACAAAALSCNKTAEEDFSLAPDQERDVYLTATMGYTPDTRAVSVSGEAISCTWNEGDQLDLALNGEVITKLTVTSVFGDRAMLSGKVKGAYPQGTQFTLFYGGTSYMYYGQSGTPESAGLRGYLKADVTIAEQDNKTLKLSAVTLEHQQAYFELRFRFGPDLIPVKTLRVVNMGPDTSTPDDPNDSTEVAGKIVRSWELGADPEFNYFGTGSNAFAVSSVGTEAPTTVYFAMRDNTEGTGKLTYKFEVTGTNNVTYTAHPKDMGTGPIQNGRYYSGEWILNKKAVGGDYGGATLEEPTGIAGLVYNGEQQDLITAGMLKDNVSEEAGVGTKMKYYVRYFAPNVITDTSVPGPNVDGWDDTLPQGKEPGTYYIYYQVIGGDYYESIAPAAIAGNPVVIDKRTVSITAPTVITGLKYTGSAQALVNAGTVADKTDPEFFEDGLVMKYFVKRFALDYTPTSDDLAAPSTSATGWVSDVPVGTNAAKYYVWYKVDGNAHYYDYSENNETVLGPIMTPIAAAEAVVGNPVPIEGLVYNGVEQQLVLPADASEGCKVYYLVTTSATLVPTAESAATTDPYSTGWVLPTDTEPAKRAPKEKNAGTYYVWTKIVEDEGSHNYTDAPGISAAPVVALIDKASINAAEPAPKVVGDWTFDNTEHVLTGSAVGVTFISSSDNNDALKEAIPAQLYYKVNDGEWTLYDTDNPNLPKAINAGNYTVKYKVEGGRNFKSKAETQLGTVVVSQANPFTPPTGVTFTAAVAQDNWTYDTNSKALLKTGASMTGQNCVVDYKVTNTNVMPAVTSTGWNTAIPTESNAGTYYVWTRVTCSGTPDNYVDAVYQTPAVVAVAKATPTATVTSNAPLTYTGTDQDLVTCSAVTATCSVKYYVTDSSTASASTDENDWKTTAQGKNSGNYYVWYKIVGNSNYYNVDPVKITEAVEIKKATLTATADNKSREYNTANPEFTVTVTGFVNGETAITAAGYVAPTASCTATQTSAVNTYPITVSGGSASNYEFNYVAGTLTITAAAASATVTAVSPLTYDATEKELVTCTDVVGGTVKYKVTTTDSETAPPEGEWATDIPKATNAGTYYVWYMIEGDTNHSDKAATKVSVTIDKAAATLTLAPTALNFESGDAVDSSKEIIVTTNVVANSGNLTVESSDSSIAEATISGTTVTVKRITDAEVSTPITITVKAKDSNHTETTAECTVTMEAAAVAFVLDLSTVEEDSTPVVVADGYTITGTLGNNRQISIAGGATVTLDNVSINAGGAFTTGNHAGITCEGLATIILKDGTSNTVKGFANTYPGIYVPSGVTLVIQGNTGVLTASSNGNAAGIGAGNGTACGNIMIQGGTITATGGENAAGIGGASNGNCGYIELNGGTITANGGANAAGIGCGNGSGCGEITITTTVTKVTATKGSDAPYSIGLGVGSTGCGTITIGGTEYYKNGAPVDEAAATYLGQATITYPAP